MSQVIDHPFPWFAPLARDSDVVGRRWRFHLLPMHQVATFDGLEDTWNLICHAQVISVDGTEIREQTLWLGEWRLDLGHDPAGLQAALREGVLKGKPTIRRRMDRDDGTRDVAVPQLVFTAAHIRSRLAKL